MTLPPTLGALLARQAATHAGRACLLGDDGAVSFDALDARVRRVAEGLRAAGLRRGDALLLMVPGRLAFLEAFLGAASAGIAPVPVDPSLTDDEAAYVAGHVRARAVVLPRARVPGLPRLRVEAPRLEAAFVLDADAPGEGFLPFDALHAHDPAPHDPAVGATDLAAIVYTAGTTGRPKGALLTHANYLTTAEAFAEAAGLTASDRLLGLHPLHHAHAQVACLLAPLLRGAALALLPAFAPGPFAAALARHRVTVVAASPTVYAVLAEAPPGNGTDALRLALSSGAPLPAPVRGRAEQALGVPVLDAYGLTEGSGVSTLEPLDPSRRRPGSVGRPLPGQEVSVVDEGGLPVPPGQVGEVLVRGPNVLRGYHRDPEATAQVVRHGWLRTGDLGRLDAEGYLWIVGRRKALILRGGESVYPREVEEVLQRHPAVREAAVVGWPDAVWGETVAAAIVPEGEAPTPEELRAYAARHLAPFKVPEHWRFVEALPRTPTGEVRRDLLRPEHLPGGSGSAAA